LDEEVHPCLGKVGNNNKFCSKLCQEGVSHCGTGRHAAKFAVAPNTAYIRVTDNQVFKTPTLDLSLLTNLQRAKLLSSLQLPTEWEGDFKLLAEGKMPMWLEDLEETSIDMDPAVVVAPDELLSPSATKRSGIFDVPKFSFERTTSEELEDGIDLLDRHLGRMESRPEGLKSKLARPFLDIETSYNVLVADLSNLHSKLKKVVLQMGVQKDGNKDLHSTVFGSIHQLRLRGNFLDEARAKLESNFNQLASAHSNLQAQVDSLSDEVTELQGITGQLESWSNSVNKSVEIFHKRFVIIKPLLSKFTGENKENVVDFPAPSSLLSPTTMDPDTLYQHIIDLEETVKILGNRVVGAGVHMGGCVF
jgi:hypothetical protein